MVKRFLWALVGLPLAIVLVSISVANRQPVALILDPFRKSFSIALPLYAYLLGALILGVVLGGLATWMTQSRWRRTARAKSQDAMRWQAEADRLSRERDASVEHQGPGGAGRSLALTSRRS